MAIPFTGATNVTLYSTGYTVPRTGGGTFALDISYLPSSWANTDSVPAGGYTFYHLHSTAKQTITFNDQGSSVLLPLVSGIGQVWLVAGVDSSGRLVAEILNYANSDQSYTGKPTTIVVAPVAVPNPINKTISVEVVGVSPGVFGWRIIATDNTTFLKYRLLIKQDGTIQGWFLFTAPVGDNPLYSRYVVNVSAGNTTGYDTTLAGNLRLGLLTYDGAGNETYVITSTIPFVDPTAPNNCVYNAFDGAGCANGWLINGQSFGGCSVPYPQVSGGGPLFLFAADLSSYSELVFSPGDAGVKANADGGYGPRWADEWLVTVSSEGNWYYMQTNAINPTVMDVYTSVFTAPPSTRRNIDQRALGFLPVPFCVQDEPCFIV